MIRECGNVYLRAQNTDCGTRRRLSRTCSEDSLSQGPTSASSSTSLTAVLSDLHTPWSHNLSCRLPLFVDAGAGSCR